MKKIIFIACAGLFSGLVMAANTVKFEGMLAAQTCTVTVNGQPGSVVVTLPVVSTDDLPALGTYAGLTEFSIEISQCGYQGSYVSPRFIANNMYHTGDLDNLSGPGYAQNVVVSVGISPGFFIHLGDQTMNSSNSIQLQGTGSNRYGSRVYYARYRAMGAVTAGKVRASVQYAMVYP